jgi:hypothetical protein
MFLVCEGGGPSFAPAGTRGLTLLAAWRAAGAFGAGRSVSRSFARREGTSRE